jgi:hypothetical protein
VAGFAGWHATNIGAIVLCGKQGCAFRDAKSSSRGEIAHRGGGMREDARYITDFHDFTKGPLTAEDLPRLELEIYGQNDRARAVMFGSLVENALRTFLRKHQRSSLTKTDDRSLFDYRGPMGTFSAKILIGYTFNLYGPNTRHDLDLVRIMRNEFAHSRKSFDFESPAVAAVCAKLRIPDAPGTFIPADYLNIVPHEELPKASNKSHPRTRFIVACHETAIRLLHNFGEIKTGGFDPVPDLT